MSEELIKAYDKLEIEDKRNQLSSELMIIGEMLRTLSKYFNIDTDLIIKNYDSSDEMSESETLTFLYGDIYNIKREILPLFNFICLNDEK